MRAHLLLTVVLAVLPSTVARAGDAPATDRIASLEALVARLEARDAVLGGERAEAVRSLVHDVLADADTRASLLQSGMTAGYDGGFVVRSADGSFGLTLNGQVQARAIYSHQNNSPVLSGGDDNLFGFENTRTKLIFSGHVGSPDWRYRVEGDFRRFNGRFRLDDAWIAGTLGGGWTLRLGQFKSPVNREFLVHSSQQLAIERSNVSYLYDAGRTQGVMLEYRDDAFRLAASFNDGAGTANTTVVGGPTDTEWSFSTRVEWLLDGDWGQFDDFTSPRGSERGLLVGGGLQYQNVEYGTALIANEFETLFLSADISIELDGATLFGSFHYAKNDNDATVDADQLAIVAQGGYYLTDDTEAYLRYEWNDSDDFPTAGANHLNILTVGLNHYYSPNVKASADIGFAFDPVSATDVSTITGWRGDAPGEDGQIVLRGQVQLTF